MNALHLYVLHSLPWKKLEILHLIYKTLIFQTYQILKYYNFYILTLSIWFIWIWIYKIKMLCSRKLKIAFVLLCEIWYYFRKVSLNLTEAIKLWRSLEIRHLRGINCFICANIWSNALSKDTLEKKLRLKC